MTPTTANAPTAVTRRPAVWAAALWLVAFAVYLPTRHYGFVYYDDQAYVADNPYVHQGLTDASIRWACSAVVQDDYHPVTRLAELTVAQLFGPTAAAFHTANAALHATSVALLFAFLARATARPGPSIAAAALWGLHPLRVESVAWIAEAKGQVSGVLFLGCLLAYAHYGRRRTTGRWLAVALLMALAMLAKSTTVPLPAVLLLTDLWPLGGDRPAVGVTRWWRRRLAEKLPLFALAAGAAAITVHTHGSVGQLTTFPLSTRVANAVASVADYIRQTVWPTGSAAFYPHPAVLGRPVPTVPLIAGGTLLIGLTIVAFLARRRRPYLAVGWLWFLVLLSPTLGLLQQGDMARADRYTYLPAIGLTVAAVWLVADRKPASEVPRRPGWPLTPTATTTLASTVALALLVATVRLERSWRDADALWTRADTVVPDNYLARAFRSDLARVAGDLPAAERFARSSIDAAPNAPDGGHDALAATLAARGRPTDALREFETALRLAPGNAATHYQAGLLLSDLHRDPVAARQLQTAIGLDPALVGPRHALAFLLGREGRYAEAVPVFADVVALSPGNGQYEGELADALRLSGDPAAAVPHYAAALAGGATNPQWGAQLAWIVAHDRRSTPQQLASAEPAARAACDRTGRRDPFPLFAEFAVLLRLGRTAEAIPVGTAARDAARRTGRPAMADAIGRQLDAATGPPATAGPASKGVGS